MSTKSSTGPTMTVKEGVLPERLPIEAAALTTEQQKKKDQEKVVAIFRWYENPGGTCSFGAYRRYRDEPMLLSSDLTFTDGHKYTVPYGLVRHVNEDCAYPEHSYLMDANGVPIPSKRKGYQRMEFIPSW